MNRKRKEPKSMPDNVIDFWNRAEKVIADSVPNNPFTLDSERARKDRAKNNARVARMYRLKKSNG